MNKHFKCVSKTETEQGFSVHFTVVVDGNPPSQVQGNLSLNNLTETEADNYSVGSVYQLTPVI